jgi:hypothetical protein
MRRRTVAIPAITLFLLGVLYVSFRVTARVPARAPQRLTFHLQITDQRLTSGAAVLPAVQGDVITLVVTSNHADTLHVHEYEQHLVIPLEPDREMTSSFTADRAGRFPVHLIGPHGEFVEIAAVEVQP